MSEVFPGHAALQVKTPDELAPFLFHAVQLTHPVFEDSKTFVDSVPVHNDWAGLEEKYLRLKTNIDDFDDSHLKHFVEDNFRLPTMAGSDFEYDPDRKLDDHIDTVWESLMYYRPDDEGTLIGVENKYPKPGGRFREGYPNHDSPATAMSFGLRNKWGEMLGMAKNYESILDRFGIVPNGYRTYYLSRAQRPMTTEVLDILSVYFGRKEILLRFLPAMLKEYAYWTDGSEIVCESDPAYRCVVRMPDGSLLNRYYDDKDTPRPESYREDILESERAGYVGARERRHNRHKRGGAASARDYCGDFFKDGINITTCNTTDYVSPELSTLVGTLEKYIGEGYMYRGNTDKAVEFEIKYQNRVKAINKYCLDKKLGWYFNYDYTTGKRHHIWALSNTAFALDAGIMPQPIVQKAAKNVKERFVADHGVLETLDNSGENWGGENMWLVDVLKLVRGLHRRGQKQLAEEVRTLAVGNAEDTYNDPELHVTPEKYNAVHGGIGGGGEYKTQGANKKEAGFALNNGPLDALRRRAYERGTYRRYAERDKLKHGIGTLALL